MPLASSLPLRRSAAAAMLSTSSSAMSELLSSPRESMSFDCLIVGGGPAGLAAAIRLKQLAAKEKKEISVAVLEKGAEIGAHILSGNVFEPRALEELFPDYKSMENPPPLDTPVLEDRFKYLHSATGGVVDIPTVLLPPQLHNDGNYIISLNQLVRWLATQAEGLGVELFPGFAASEVMYSADKKSVLGIATRDVGIDKNGNPKDTYARGMELRARQTVFAEGARGSCSEEIMKTFNLREGVQPQTFGLGVKEVWEVPAENFQAGYVQHTLGWPLQTEIFSKTFGGSFLYHMKPNLVLIGFVVGLDYENPYLNPYREFQRWKTHPEIKKHLVNGKCISYGARVLNEGGLHAIPKVTFPGGVLVGCSAGFLNGVKIKGSHTALKSGAVAAEAIFPLLTADESMIVAKREAGDIDPEEKVGEAVAYAENMKKSWVYDELKEVRNCHAAFHWGFLPGLVYSGIAAHVFKGREPWTLSNTKTDAEKTGLAKNFSEIVYPQPDNVFSFDLLTNLQRSGTSHESDQPAHLRVKESEAAFVSSSKSLTEFGGPEQRFCPAGVYEYVDVEKPKAGEPAKKLQINAQNCVHCKCCSIKMPHEYIDWTVPEGGGGPAYTVM